MNLDALLAIKVREIAVFAGLLTLRQPIKENAIHCQVRYQMEIAQTDRSLTATSLIIRRAIIVRQCAIVATARHRITAQGVVKEPCIKAIAPTRIRMEFVKGLMGWSLITSRDRKSVV